MISGDSSDGGGTGRREWGGRGGRGGEGREERKGEGKERRKGMERGGEMGVSVCTDGVSLVIHPVLHSGHLPATATQSASTTGPSAARVMIFMRSSL